jgi:transposase
VISGVTAIGVDEIQVHRGHKYVTLVYEISGQCRRLLWIGKERREATLNRFFDLLGESIVPTLEFVCSDMWKPYIKVIRARAGEAVHILDRYHVMSMMNKAIDKVRAEETRQLKKDGFEPILKNSRWCLLKRTVNLTRKQTVKLKELMQYNLRTMRAYLLKEDFQRFWQYTSPVAARQFLREWCTRTMRSKLGPMKKVAKTVRRHQDLLVNWFLAKGEISAGIVEGFNNKAKLTIRKSYGSRSDDGLEIALYHSLGRLPEKNLTHESC